ncbi:MAG: endo alpha-1,4 polygalactosaminidase [Propioniciclava sp.]|nr:endo alpha-1,4 polygalactosaminidase [Propioniciclava sp.]
MVRGTRPRSRAVAVGAALAVLAVLAVAGCGAAPEPVPDAEAAPAATVTRGPAVVRTTPPPPDAAAAEEDPMATPSPTPSPTADASAAGGRGSGSGSTAPGGWWRPAVGTTWQWQLSGTVDTSVSAAVFDIDGEQATAALVADLHRRGAKVICYIDVGAWESYRRDASAFPSSVLGNRVDGWDQERWLDIRKLDVLLPIMEARIADCAAKGFDAVEPDLADGYLNDTGFPLKAADQIAYNTAIADLAHKHGMGVGLKNDAEQVTQLEPYFDFAVVEECVAYGECDAYVPFIRAGKAVLHVEYSGSTSSICKTTKPLGFSSMKKRLDLDAWREVC